MKNNKILIVLAAVLVVLLAAAFILYGKLTETMERNNLAVQETTETASVNNEETELTLAPDFIMTDKDGNEVSLSDFRGKPVVLNFWASWCGPCKSEMPEFEEAYKTYGDNVHFLMVNLTDGVQETVETAQSFIDSVGYTFPVYFDTQYGGAMNYGVSSIPVTFFLDAEGHAVAQAVGAMDAATLQTGIDMIYP